MRVFEAQKQHNEEAKMFSMAPRPTESVIGVNSQWLSSPGRALARYRSFQRCLVTQGRTTLREQLTYPTWGKGKSYSKSALVGDMLVPRMVAQITYLI